MAGCTIAAKHAIAVQSSRIQLPQVTDLPIKGHAAIAAILTPALQSSSL